MEVQNRLPATLRSVYRLFLRASSAAVLNHGRACSNLRQRWRPAFDAAARVTKELQQASSEAPVGWKEQREQWLKLWNERSE
jgi:hypothetical protein